MKVLSMVSFILMVAWAVAVFSTIGGMIFSRRFRAYIRDEFGF